MTIELRGFAELREKLQQLPDKLAAKVLAKAMKAAFQPVLDDAKAKVPVDTGALRDSLRIAFRRGGRGEPMRVGIRIGSSSKVKQAGLAKAVFGGTTKAPPARRWHFIELGTADLAAHPFLRPALDANQGRVLSILKTEIAAGLAEIARGK